MLVDLHAIVRHTLDAKDPHPHQINISQLSMSINIANYQHLKFLQRIIWLRHGPRSQLVIKLHCNLRSHQLHHYLLQYQLRSFLDNDLLLFIPNSTPGSLEATEEMDYMQVYKPVRNSRRQSMR